MDPFEELERLAANALANNAVEEAQTGPTETDIQRWQRWFNYSYSEAADQIERHRSDLTRNSVSDEYWNDVKAQYQVNGFEGFDKEAFEHELERRAAAAKLRPLEQPLQQSNQTFLLEMDGPLEDMEKIQEITKLSSPPEIKIGHSEERTTRFCRIPSAGKAMIEHWLSQQQTNFRPTFVPESMASKDLSLFCNGLGTDTMLPHHRLDTSDQEFLPKQSDYPVPYFFYGTLGDVAVLSRLLGLTNEDIGPLKSASIGHGVLKTWGGRYNALVDGGPESTVEGVVYEVVSAEHEEALRAYETMKYEVVRCKIRLHSEEREVSGLTFRFVDPKLLL
ncbi:hypothetical protein ACLMJK_004390 [Lecanora helva]